MTETWFWGCRDNNDHYNNIASLLGAYYVSDNILVLLTSPHSAITPCGKFSGAQFLKEKNVIKSSKQFAPKTNHLLTG